MNTTYVGYINVFKPFCDEKRLRILELLQSGEKCACELLEDLDIGQSSLSYHMKILVESGVVESWNEGKWTHYSISKKGINYAVELLNILTTTDTKNSNDNSCKC